MPYRNILVRHPEQLTAHWAQHVIRQHDAQAIVKQVLINQVDVGTTTRVRLTVEFEQAGQLPKSWFVKLPSLSKKARFITALPRLLHNEVRFYNELAHCVPVSKPNCLAAHSRFGFGATLVLTDVRESLAVPSHPNDTLNPQQARLVIEQLANFHAHFWQRVHDEHYQWLRSSVRKLEDHLGSVLAVPLMRRGLHLAGTVVPKRLHQPALAYAKQCRKVMEFLHHAPHTLVHHDCHSGNLFWSLDKSQAGFLDWQMVRTGEGISDVAYFLATTLQPETRAQHEMALLQYYQTLLMARGIVLSDHDLLQRYRAHLSYAFEAMIVTLAVGGMMKQQHNLELIRRTAAAVDALDAFSALTV